MCSFQSSEGNVIYNHPFVEQMKEHVLVVKDPFSPLLQFTAYGLLCEGDLQHMTRQTLSAFIASHRPLIHMRAVRNRMPLRQRQHPSFMRKALLSQIEMGLSRASRKYLLGTSHTESFESYESY